MEHIGEQVIELFRKNIIVIILPLILMIFIFFGGYYFLKESDQMTNEQLAQTISFDAILTETDDQIWIEGQWDWNEIPQDAIIGDDYIGITLTNSANEVVDFTVSEPKLKLINDGETIYEAEGKKRGSGYLFAFPNKVSGQKLFGKKGSFSLMIDQPVPEDYQVIASFLHTWADHGGLKSEDPRFLTVEFEQNIYGKYWVIEQFLTGKLE